MGSIALDVILVVVLLGFLLAGLRKGVWATLGGVFGFLVGATAAFFAIPLVASWVPDPLWRVVAVIAAAIVLVAAGHGLGSAAGAEVQRMFNSRAVRGLSSLVGGVVNVVVAMFVIALLSFSISAMGFPTVNQTMKQSTVLSTIDSAVPEQAESWFAQVRSAVLDSDIPEIAQLVPEPAELPEDQDLNDAGLESAASVGRITGVAEQCGQSQSGSGFAVSPTRVLTNAHVIAGVAEPAVEMPDGEVLTGRAVHFDPASDLALIAVDGLDVAPLEVSDGVDVGDSGYVMGYPAGGPFSAGSAVVQARDVSQVNNIYGSSPSSLEIFQLSADVRQGNSGGPLIDASGDVAGVVFARAVEGSNVGFAITADQAGDVLTDPDRYSETVSTGQCTDR
ncbi:MarP family serine protease [Nesterenkonia sandarakina]|uniref:Colicin V production protein n=1 Tax=Nesterenkonia sandarakina TaxID=272918 RepID=A0A2T0YGJ9_9MICC|nr:MarP family serine protease [Nesterenkonia sandarakina]PRZ14056.1 colicin V production protein [Nesterenkonia sandarakina]